MLNPSDLRHWFVDPSVMCDHHLLHEHIFCHILGREVIHGTRPSEWFGGHRTADAFRNRKRHDRLAREITRRGIKHKCGIPAEYDDLLVEKYPQEVIRARVDKKKALCELIAHCPQCRARFENLHAHKREIRELHEIAPARRYFSMMHSHPLAMREAELDHIATKLTGNVRKHKAAKTTARAMKKAEKKTMKTRKCCKYCGK